MRAAASSMSAAESGGEPLGRDQRGHVLELLVGPHDVDKADSLDRKTVGDATARISPTLTMNGRRSLPRKGGDTEL